MSKLNVPMIGLSAALGVDMVIAGTTTLHNDFQLCSMGTSEEIVEIDDTIHAWPVSVADGEVTEWRFDSDEDMAEHLAWYNRHTWDKK